ncbi:MAG TPA: dienelactone hydrolase family protein [Aliidongia sp.]|nr:dienelactone hydrolase family protein [Aliidongia sp.]
MRLIFLAILSIPAWPGVAAAETVEIPETDGTVLQATLFRPPPDVPVGTAVVALYGCGGPYPSRDRQWTETLTGTGHAVLFPDSFASHGLGPQCRVRQRAPGFAEMRRQDALAAASWLAAQKETPPGGIVLFGWSNGAGAVLRAGRSAPDVPAGLFRGLVAFYPPCAFVKPSADRRFVAPLLLLIGESDDWTPAAPCRDLAAKAASAVTLRTYPGAYHDFDAPVPVRIMEHAAFAENPNGQVHVGGEPAARQDALMRVPAFIAGLP